MAAPPSLGLFIAGGAVIGAFAIAVSASIAASAIKLVGGTTAPASGGATTAGRRADSPDGKPSRDRIDEPSERRAA